MDVGQRGVVVLAAAAWRVQRRGAHALLGLKRLQDLLVVELQRLAELADRRRAAEARGQLGAVLVDLQRAFLQLTRRTDRPAAVAEVAAQFADDRGDGEARERDAAGRIKAIDGLQEPEAGDLQQIVERLLGLAIALAIDRASGRKRSTSASRRRGSRLSACGKELRVRQRGARSLGRYRAKVRRSRHGNHVPMRTVR